MYKDLLEKAISHFNNNEVEQLHEMWHDDLEVIRFMTGDILVKGKEELINANRPYMEEGNIKFKIINMIEFNNIVITFSELVGMDIERITIYEIIDNKFKRTWISQWPKDKEE